jgi:hypothetical protein
MRAAIIVSVHRKMQPMTSTNAERNELSVPGKIIECFVMHTKIKRPLLLLLFFNKIPQLFKEILCYFLLLCDNFHMKQAKK